MKLNRRIIVIAAEPLALWRSAARASPRRSEAAPRSRSPVRLPRQAEGRSARGGRRRDRARDRASGRRRRGRYEVEVRRPDGSQVEIHLDDRSSPSARRQTTTPGRGRKTSPGKTRTRRSSQPSTSRNAEGRFHPARRRAWTSRGGSHLSLIFSGHNRNRASARRRGRREDGRAPPARTRRGGALRRHRADGRRRALDGSARPSTTRSCST